MLWSYIVDNFTNAAYLFGVQWPFTATPLFLAAYVPLFNFQQYSVQLVTNTF